MGTWTAIERAALLATVLVHLLLGWALTRLVQQSSPPEQPGYTEVVFLPRRSSPATIPPVEPSPAQSAADVFTHLVMRPPRAAHAASDSAGAPTRPTPERPAASPASVPVADGPVGTTLDLRMHTPDVVLIPARAPWERATTLEAKPTRFAKHWREPKSISQIISDLGPPGGIKDPAQLCSDGERLMQKRGCDALFTRAHSIPEELP